MLTRISLILAIVAGLAVGGINFVKIKATITDLRTNLQQQTDRANTAEHSLAKAKTELAKTTDELTQTKQSLETSKASEAKAVAEAAAQTKKVAQLSDDLAKTRKDRDQAQGDLSAYTVLGFTPKQVMDLGNQLKQTQENLDISQEEKKVLQRKLTRVQTELAKIQTPDYHVILPASLVGKIVVTDPKWDFVVLNVGEDQGVLQDGELLVNRNGRLVAKVKVSSVQHNRSIANVVPGWKLGEVIEGDQVIPAYPSS